MINYINKYDITINIHEYYYSIFITVRTTIKITAVIVTCMTITLHTNGYKTSTYCTTHNTYLYYYSNMYDLQQEIVLL